MFKPEGNTTPVIIVGAHNEILELCELLGKTVLGLVQGPDTVDQSKYPVLGSDADVKRLYQKYDNASVIVTPDAPSVRRQLSQLYTSAGFSLAELVHTGATISSSSKIGAGAIIQNGVNVSSNTVLGQSVKLNTFANIMHDCRVGDYVTVAPNAVILGRVSLGDHCYVGAGAIVLPGIRIGKEAMVGAGAVVTRDVADGVTVVGNPARALNR